ncbi:MAG: B12-binding domain-containing radical SAM protein [Dehalococcoidia bacterium]|nr:B12-binding domain-containing radical SAM protein [Dehalococcoidia bacterium]
MKISIIEPKAPFYNFYSAFIKRLPLLGPIYLGTILKNEGHDVTIYNENIKEVDYSKIKDSDILAISIITSTAPRGYEIAKRYRSLNPMGKIIIGGSHATFLPEEAAQYADHVVTGEGELVISDLIKSGGEKIVPGIPVENLDDLPFPDFSLIYGAKTPLPITPISTSRGCPYACTFCSVSPMFGRRYRFRTTESVIRELSRFKHRHIFFYDDNFGANRARTKELLNQMIEHGITPRWIAQVRADVAKDEELVELMAKANCRQLCIGFESINPEMLRRYNKKQTPGDVNTCIEVLHKYGIKVHGMFISEGYSDYNKLGIDSLQLSILVPLIGSKLYTMVKDAGQLIVKRFPKDWELFDGGHVVHWPENMSPLEMQKQTIQAMQNFYSRYNATKMLLKGRIRDFRIRLMGYIILKKWEAQNKDYLAKLRQAQTAFSAL